jgi:hypothetical protein
MGKERRSYPRYPVLCPVEVTVPEGTPGVVYPAESGTLSRTSIQIACGADLVAALLKQQRLPHMCRLQFALPWHKKHTFRLDASVVTHRRLSQQQYVLVLLLRHNDSQQEHLLDSLLLRQQKPIGLE